MKVLKRYTKRLAPVVVAFALLQGFAPTAYAATLTGASTTLSNSTPSAATTSYVIDVDAVTTSAHECFKIEFDTAADGSGGKPAGMNIASATYDAANSDYVPDAETWVVTNTDATGIIEIDQQNASGETPASASDRTLEIDGITNPNSATSFYVIFNTYGNDDCSTTPRDSVVMAVATTSNTTVSVVVDPTLTFAVADNAAATCNGVSENGTSSSSTAVNLGRASTGTNRFQAQQLHASTNAASGYTVYARYTAAMNDGSGHTITDWTGTNGSPTATWAAGNEYLGYTVDDASLSGTATRFTAGGAKFAALTTSNAEVHYHTGPIDETSSNFGCIGFQVGINGATEAGSYSATVVYTAVPLF